jgi:hypothetical protein
MAAHTAYRRVTTPLHGVLDTTRHVSCMYCHLARIKGRIRIHDTGGWGGGGGGGGTDLNPLDVPEAGRLSQLLLQLWVRHDSDNLFQSLTFQTICLLSHTGGCYRFIIDVYLKNLYAELTWELLTGTVLYHAVGDVCTVCISDFC